MHTSLDLPPLLPSPSANEVLFHFSDIVLSFSLSFYRPSPFFFCHINCSIHCKHRTSNAKMQQLWLCYLGLYRGLYLSHYLSLFLWHYLILYLRFLPPSLSVLLLGAAHAKQTIVELGRRRRLRRHLRILEPFALQVAFTLSLLLLPLLLPPKACVAVAIKANKLAKSSLPSSPASASPTQSAAAKKKWLKEKIGQHDNPDMRH